MRLLCRLAQEDASQTITIDNGNLRKVRAELLSASTALFASLHEKLTTYARSSPHLGLAGAAMYVMCMQPRASRFTFSACMLAYSVDLGTFV